jgi:hypothetical protein
MFFAWLAYNTGKSPEKKSLSGILLIVDGIAFMTYVFTSLRLSPQMKDANGYPVDLVRFAEWVPSSLS